MHLLLLAALAAAALPAVAPHGILTVPPSRNWLAYRSKEKWDWPDGLNAGGYKVVGQAGAKWPHGKHGLCGDNVHTGETRFARAGDVVATYKAGQVVELHVLVSTNHYGRFEFRLCPSDATKDEQCTKLQRADGRGEAWDLPKIAEGSRFNGGALGGDNLRPMEVDTSFSWYPQPHAACDWDPHCSRYNGLPVYKLRFKLPDGAKCDRCILQWYYLSGHKCHPPCLKSDRYFPDCRANPKFRGLYLATMDYCGTEWSAYPEEFWNCADIKIQ